MEEKIFTEKELGKYDGQNGNPAYVAIDGVVYDVTNVSAWNGGVHHGNKAGQNVSEIIKKSPHGKKVLEKLERVGKLAAIGTWSWNDCSGSPKRPSSKELQEA